MTRTSALALTVILTLGNTAGAVDIVFDYTYDTTGFFNDPQRRETLERAAQSFARLADPLAAIEPGGGNTWSIIFTHPATGNDIEVANPVIAADEYRIYVGARTLSGPLGIGGFGGYDLEGFGGWGDTVQWRGQPRDSRNFVRWGGSISFDAQQSWHWDTEADVPAGKADFLSIAVHELAHTLGFGIGGPWDSWVNRDALGNTTFSGPYSQAAYGGPVPLSPGQGHWASGTRGRRAGQLVETAMDPEIFIGDRKLLTELDFAGLYDVGWQEAMPGDLNADGLVGPEDLAILRSAFGRDSITTLWADGDLDGDLDVDFADYVLLARDYGDQTAYSGFDPLSTPVSTPEPTTLTVLALGALALHRRGRDRRAA
jgi:hypothetical protein